MNEIQKSVRIARITTALGNLNYVKGVPDIPDSVGDIVDFGKDSRWSTQPTH